MKTPLEFPEVWRQQENYKVGTVQVKAGRDGEGAQSQIILKMLTPTKFCSSCRGRGRGVCGRSQGSHSLEASLCNQCGVSDGGGGVKGGGGGTNDC